MVATDLLAYGIEYNKGLQNCMGKADFYQKILTLFLQDSCFEKAKEALAAGDMKELFCQVHALKGTSGNAGLTGLYSVVTPLAELLRHGDADPEATAKMFSAMEKAYNDACKGIAVILKE